MTQSAGPASPVHSTGLLAGGWPTVATQDRAAPAVPLYSTGGFSSATLDSSPGVAIHSWPAPAAAPTCTDGSAVAADPSARSTVSRFGETALPSTTATTAQHLADHVSAAAHRWRESSLRLRSTLRAPAPPAFPRTTDNCRWPPCRSAPVPKTAHKTSLLLPPRAPACIAGFLRSPCPPNKLVANSGENHIQ